MVRKISVKFWIAKMPNFAGWTRHKVDIQSREFLGVVLVWTK